MTMPDESLMGAEDSSFQDLKVEASHRKWIRRMVGVAIAAAVLTVLSGVASKNAIPNTTSESLSLAINTLSKCCLLVAFSGMLIALRWTHLTRLVSKDAGRFKGSAFIQVAAGLAAILILFAITQALLGKIQAMPSVLRLIGASMLVVTGVGVTFACIARGPVQRFSIGASVVMILDRLTILNHVELMMFGRRGNPLSEVISQAALTLACALVAGLLGMLLVHPPKES